ncbi:MAG: hypothetical protein JWM76_679 [Pseudonocardiales bacterium]|nr:hypothetical protein [Pseudonocardiales bacterium]
MSNDKIDVIPDPGDEGLARVLVADREMLRTGGIYGLPVIGAATRRVRGFYDGIAPTDEDTAGVTVGKQILRYGTVVAAGTAGVALGAIVAL